jgi:hypothetical protein
MSDHAAQAASTPPAEPQVALACTLSGHPKHRAGLSEETVCERFALRIREALGVPVKLVGSLPGGERARWVRLEVKLLPRGRVEAALTSRLRGKATNHPALAVQVMDKPLGLSEIDRLARLAGKTLAGN